MVAIFFLIHAQAAHPPFVSLVPVQATIRMQFPDSSGALSQTEFGLVDVKQQITFMQCPGQSHPHFSSSVIFGQQTRHLPHIGNGLGLWPEIPPLAISSLIVPFSQPAADTC